MADEDHIQGAVIGRTVYLRPLGFATQQNCLGIPDFVNAMFRAGCNCVAVDLAECKGMDSTFLGVIADAATVAPHRRGKTVLVLNAMENLTRQLRRVGLLPLVCLHEGHADPPRGLQLRPLDLIHLPRAEAQRLQTVRRLHQRLVELNAGNERLFGPFLAMLDEELGLAQEPPPE